MEGHGDHRITEWSGLEGTSVGHPVQPPAQAGSPTVGCRGPCPGPLDGYGDGRMRRWKDAETEGCKKRCGDGRTQK